MLPAPTRRTAPLRLRNERCPGGSTRTSSCRHRRRSGEDERLRSRLVGGLRFSDGASEHLQPGARQAASDFVGSVPIAGQRHRPSVHLAAVHLFTVAGLERDQQVRTWCQRSQQLGADRAEVLGGGVDDGVPADRAGQRAVSRPSSKRMPGCARRATANIPGEASTPITSSPCAARSAATRPGPQPTSATGLPSACAINSTKAPSSARSIGPSIAELISVPTHCAYTSAVSS